MLIGRKARVIAIAKKPNSLSPKKGVSKMAGRFPLKLLTNERGMLNKGNRRYLFASSRGLALQDCHKAMKSSRLRPIAVTKAISGARIEDKIKPLRNHPIHPNSNFVTTPVAL